MRCRHTIAFKSKSDSRDQDIHRRSALTHVRGLINNLPNPNTKVGLVTLYDFGTFYAAKSRLVQNILKNLKTKFQNRFDCFHVENGWLSEMARLFQFA
jgi:hypothetical protein